MAELNRSEPHVGNEDMLADDESNISLSFAHVHRQCHQLMDLSQYSKYWRG